ncbi:PREDICTED: UPF0496 protein At1g20180-like [Nelumbo nucifera]|uniref:Uncharacterized protein n=2 Tax=Nelumbo nucifera TaxID=4432 RepID=A0A822ZPA2_NELNU|nr:PREDICTED: UPF0496 protein At1g20180-like [Nelumbo nucifera]DAD46727.1 TPA_asm: hypothetical protein HUJ06_016664 [Nelumbo nucifera]
MTHIRKIMRSKLRSSLTTAVGGGSPKQQEMSNVGSKLNVNEEYMEAFRTKSYVEIWSKAQGQMRRKDEDRSSSSSLPSLPSSPRLSDFLLEPRQDILVEMIKNSDQHRLLTDYFDGSLEACRICDFLLKSIDQTRANYRIIRRIISLTKRLPDSCDYTDDQCRLIFRDLDSFAKLNNPLSAGSSPVEFRLVHDRYGSMLNQLRKTRKRINKREKLIGLSKKAAGLGLIVACGAVSVITLVLVVHTLVGIIATPALLAFSVNATKKKIKSARVGLKTSMLARLGAQLDAAAKGVYILNRDFDTISGLMVRLQDEIEHGRVIAGMVVKNQTRRILKEVVREFQTHESCFLEQLGELEEHVYLCFLTINRARSLVVQEIINGAPDPPKNTRRFKLNNIRS